MARARLLAPLLAAAALLGAAPARASGGELVLAGAPLYSMVKWDQRHPSGGGVALEAAYGLNDWLWLRGVTFYTAQAASKDEANGLPAGAISVGGAFAGLRYAFDVLRVIPFVDGGIGAFFSGGAGHKGRADLGVEIGIGFDYLHSRRVSFGLVARYHAFLTNVQNIPVYLYAGPRFALRWD
ncbi:MAG: hypothetical protein HY906_28110 [Deltaproteobacteria bacterium]|nr:hypothetical protein [Deltaproteobacteria bacterium]